MFTYLPPILPPFPSLISLVVSVDDKHHVYLFAPPPIPPSPSLISLMVSVDVKHYVYLTYAVSNHCTWQWSARDVEARSRLVSFLRDVQMPSSPSSGRPQRRDCRGNSASSPTCGRSASSFMSCSLTAVCLILVGSSCW